MVESFAFVFQEVFNILFFIMEYILHLETKTKLIVEASGHKEVSQSKSPLVMTLRGKKWNKMLAKSGRNKKHKPCK